MSSPTHTVYFDLEVHRPEDFAWDQQQLADLFGPHWDEPPPSLTRPVTHDGFDMEQRKKLVAPLFMLMFPDGSVLTEDEIATDEDIEEFIRESEQIFRRWAAPKDWLWSAGWRLTWRSWGQMAAVRHCLNLISPRKTPFRAQTLAPQIPIVDMPIEPNAPTTAQLLAA